MKFTLKTKDNHDSERIRLKEQIFLAKFSYSLRAGPKFAYLLDS